MTKDWPKYIEKRVSDFADKNNLTGKKREEYLGACYDYFLQAKVPVHEPVGVLSAHSMCEPATQMTLRTKHYAGAAEVSVGSGISRLEELFDARAKTKFPVMTVYLREDVKRDKKSLNSYLKQLIYKKMEDIAVIKEDLEERKITIDFSQEVLEDYELTKEELAKNLKTLMKLSAIKETNKGFEILFKDQILLTVRKYFLKLKDLRLMGVEGIEDAILADENGEAVIKTQGSNMKGVTSLEFVDPYRTYTNDIFETYKLLGIEAARELLAAEVLNVYRKSEIAIDYRHISLIADAMCYDGDVMGVVRTGIVSTKKSPFARAAFEQTEKVLFNAAVDGEEEEFRGVVENVMAGLPIEVGVGKVELELDLEKVNLYSKQKNIVQVKEKKKQEIKEVKEKETEKENKE